MVHWMKAYIDPDPYPHIVEELYFDILCRNYALIYWVWSNSAVRFCIYSAVWLNIRPPVFYLFGRLDSAYRTSSFEIRKRRDFRSPLYIDNFLCLLRCSTSISGWEVFCGAQSRGRWVHEEHKVHLGFVSNIFFIPIQLF